MITEDIIQNVFLKLYEKFDDLNNKESANFWLFKSARNEYYNSYKKGKKTSYLSETTLLSQKDEFELENYIEQNDMKNIVLNELGKMNYEQREVFLLKEYGGLSYKEISKTLDIDVNLVKSRLYKVRQKLIDKISKLVL